MEKLRRVSAYSDYRTGLLAGYEFKCPGCGDNHRVATVQSNDRGAIWAFDGNLERPTFSPSLLVQSGHFCGADETGCWCKYAAEHPEKKNVPTCYLCHSFVRGGRIEFLGDCSHALAGQTVELPLL